MLSKRLAPQPGLPPAVATMRQAIASAAIDCDYARLDTLAHSKYGFRVGFHEEVRLETYLRNESTLMKTLVDLLNEPYTTGHAVNERTQEEANTRVYFWPKVELPPDRYFYGYFVTITEDGDWSAYGLAD
ncbi:MAG: hypothetical protein JWM80_2298 [Cyanobacteria bacterium RYN_339]|nr:hypothetical protein [Cyanobacteria bacterium RYN_339]